MPTPDTQPALAATVSTVRDREGNIVAFQVPVELVRRWRSLARGSSVNDQAALEREILERLS